MHSPTQLGQLPLKSKTPTTAHKKRSGRTLPPRYQEEPETISKEADAGIDSSNPIVLGDSALSMEAAEAQLEVEDAMTDASPSTPQPVSMRGRSRYASEANLSSCEEYLEYGLCEGADLF